MDDSEYDDGGHSSVLDNIIDDEERERLCEAMQDLPQMDQAVVNLNRQGFTGQQIGEQLGLHQGTASRRLNKAIMLLRKRLES